MPASERDVGVERSLHARGGCGLWALDQVAWDAVRSLHARAGCGRHGDEGAVVAGLSTRARDAGLTHSSLPRHGLSTRARDAGDRGCPHRACGRSLHARAGCGKPRWSVCYESEVSPRARGMRVYEENSSIRPWRSLHARAGCGV